MSVAAYPWTWLAGAVGPAFTVRFPWVEAVRRLGESAAAVCVLIPEAAGPLVDWATWLEGALDVARPLAAPGPDFPALVTTLEQLGRVEPLPLTTAPKWITRFLSIARRIVPHVVPIPVVVIDPDADCTVALGDLVRAQRAINYPLARPVVLARRVPPGWVGEVVRFGLPEPTGDLHRIAPYPAEDVGFWTDAVLALAAIWEAGAIPAQADELWLQLRATRTATVSDQGFDAWLDKRLELFSRQVIWPTAPAIPQELAFAPAREGAFDDLLWQSGTVGYADGWFDLTPLRARTWVRTVAEPLAREGVGRRRLVSAPFARWLAAWAASIEESLRVLALAEGDTPFRAYLTNVPARRNRALKRWDEIAPRANESLVGNADFNDLSGFIADIRKGGTWGVMDRCRRARNRVVHERRASVRDLFDIAASVQWLSEQGLI